MSYQAKFDKATSIVQNLPKGGPVQPSQDDQLFVRGCQILSYPSRQSKLTCNLPTYIRRSSNPRLAHFSDLSIINLTPPHLDNIHSRTPSSPINRNNSSMLVSNKVRNASPNQKFKIKKLNYFIYLVTDFESQRRSVMWISLDLVCSISPVKPSGKFFCSVIHSLIVFSPRMEDGRR